MEVRRGYRQNEVGVTPADWDVKSLGTFVALQRGHDLTERDRRRGEVPVMGSAGPNGFHDTARVCGPGVVLGRSGASFGQAHYCRTDFWPHNTALYVTDFLGNDVLFAFYFLKGIDFSRHNSGGAQQSLNRNFIAPILVAVPKRKEQEVIADALSDADALIESLEQLLTKKRQLKQGAMQELLTGKKRVAGFQTKPGYKQTEVGVIPQDWAVSTVGAEFSIQLGKMLDAENNVGVSKPFLGNRSVQWGRIDPTDLGEVKLTPSDLQRFRLRKGDMLVCEGGEIGRAAIWRQPIEECYYQKALHRLRPIRGYNVELMLNVLQRLASTGFLLNFVTQTSIAHLPKDKFETVPIPLPPTKAEQEAIAAILFDMDAEMVALETKHAKACQLKQGVMQELLTGRIRLV